MHSYQTVTLSESALKLIKTLPLSEEDMEEVTEALEQVTHPKHSKHHSKLENLLGILRNN